MDAVVLKKRSLNSKVGLRKSKKTDNTLSKSDDLKAFHSIYSASETNSDRNVLERFTL